MAFVNGSMPQWSNTAGQIGKIPSSSLLADPIVKGTNHLLGYKLTGLLHSQTSDSGALTGTGRFYTYRHPNSDYLVAHFKVKTGPTMSEEILPDTITFTAGSGAATTCNVYGPGLQTCVFPWGGSGWLEVKYAVNSETGSEISNMSIWNAARLELDSSDMGFDTFDADHTRGGTNSGQYIIYNDATTHIPGLINDIKSLRGYQTRQAVSWSHMGAGLTLDAESYKNLFGPNNSYKFRHQAMPGHASYRIYFRSYHSGYGAGDTYSVKCSYHKGAGSVEKTGLSYTSATWTYINAGDLTVSATETDSITFEMKSVIASGTPIIHLCDLSICSVPG